MGLTCYGNTKDMANDHTALDNNCLRVIKKAPRNVKLKSCYETNWGRRELVKY
jgi:hypothetical protein